MSHRCLGQAEFIAVLDGGLQEVIRNHQQLSDLDSIGGDGDHGITMLRAAESIRTMLREPAPDISTLLGRVADSLLSNDGGASGSLLGSFFLGAAESCRGRDELDCVSLSAAFASGLNALKRYTMAKVGDKTLLDALEPAVAAVEQAALRNESLETALESAAAAASEGAAQTRNMQARFGRAQYLGPRTIGSQDPGATTISLLFQGFARAMEGAKGTNHG